jgi:hypothetical protein
MLAPKIDFCAFWQIKMYPQIPWQLIQWSKKERDIKLSWIGSFVPYFPKAISSKSSKLSRKTRSFFASLLLVILANEYGNIVKYKILLSFNPRAIKSYRSRRQRQ